jgi:hypothetical protein
MNGLSPSRPTTGPALVALILLPLPLSGCIAVAAGAAAGYGAYTYQEGRVSGTTGASLDRTYAAALAALQDSGLSIDEKLRTSHSASITAHTADRTEVTLDLAKRASSMTRVDIRWGLMGDEKRSRQLLSAIKGRLE